MEITEDSIRVIVADEIKDCQKIERETIAKLEKRIEDVYNRLWWLVALGLTQLCGLLFLLLRKVL